MKINENGLTNLLYMTAYDWFLKYGRQQSFVEFRTHINNMELNDLPDEVVKAGYEVASDLYDENERSGFNDEQYPWRKRSTLPELQQLRDDLIYIANLVYDLYSASEGSAMAEITEGRLDNLMDWMNDLASINFPLVYETLDAYITTNADVLEHNQWMKIRQQRDLIKFNGDGRLITDI